MQNIVIRVDVEPVDAPDVYLLIGQSNMVGFSGDGTKDAGEGGPDEPNPRIQQLNVTKNSLDEVFVDGASFTNTSTIATTPLLVQAEDPLHVPQDPDTLSKEENYIGMGLSFAKRALLDTSRQIVLVPAAWSGSAFCATSNVWANWNATNPNNANLGNTLLFDRALARVNLALNESGGILRGILWHQGESDADIAAPACAELYENNLKNMVSEFRRRITPDARGTDARGPDANIPFVAGTMSRGFDENSDFRELFPEKQIIDSVHRSVEWLIPHAAFSWHDDLIPSNGFPCGNTSCIHFGAEAFREMGKLYYGALIEAAQR